MSEQEINAITTAFLRRIKEDLCDIHSILLNHILNHINNVCKEDLCKIHSTLLSHINNVCGENIYDLQNKIQDIIDLIEKTRKENYGKHKICKWALYSILTLELAIENMNEEDNIVQLKVADSIIEHVINSINADLYS